MTNASLLPEKKQVAQSFADAAEHYDDVAVLQRLTADDLFKHLDHFQLDVKHVVDLGSGTGRNLSLLKQRYPDAQLMAVDLATAMLNKAKQHMKQHAYFVAGDAEQLPFADETVDLIYANLALQWCKPNLCFREIARVLRPNAIIAFTSLAPLTLYELKKAWASVDKYQHVNAFYSENDLLQAMREAGLATEKLHQQITKLQYQDVMSLMRDLKTLGAHNVNKGRRRGLTGKRALKQMVESYEQFRDEDNVLPASYDVIYAVMRKLS
jgi:malonyl-CoA O-methyltransferase